MGRTKRMKNQPSKTIKTNLWVQIDGKKVDSIHNHTIFVNPKNPRRGHLKDGREVVKKGKNWYYIPPK